MAIELLLLGALIFIFIVSFCGLLQKIRNTYERERLLAERIARRRQEQRTSADSFTEVYINSAFTTDANGSIFPAAPPPYSHHYVEPPPKYEEVVKVHQPISIVSTPNEVLASENRPVTDTTPPPYTINLTLVAEPPYQR